MSRKIPNPPPPAGAVKPPPPVGGRIVGMEPGLIPLIHRACGKPAFWATERPRLGERPDLTKLRLADGSRPIAGTKPVCASCGANFMLWEVTPDGGWH